MDTHRLRTQPSDARLLVGLFVQPFLAAGVAFLSFPFLLLDRSGRTLAGGLTSDPTDAAVSVAVGVGVVALVVTVVGVLPTVLWLTERRHPSLTETLLFGLAFGNLPYVLMAIAAGGTYGFTGFIRGVGFSSLLGLTGAAIFWAIALRRNRSQSAAG
jgi:hypothetical protein